MLEFLSRPMSIQAKPSSTLTRRQRNFVAAYLDDPALNQEKAYISAGYSAKGASVGASRLTRHPTVAAAIDEERVKRIEALGLNPARILEELRRIALCDYRTLFDEKGNLRPVTEWTEELGSCVTSIEVVKRNLHPDDGQTDLIHRVRLADKVKALEALSKHFGLLVDRHDHTGTIVFEHEQLDTIDVTPAQTTPESP
jgi:phage terminase small subunit